MKIAILETGRPPEGLGDVYGHYPQMFQKLLDGHGFEFQSFWVQAQEWPTLHDFDALIVTGSPAGVYEDHDWIAPLEELIRAAGDQQVPVAGLCFGHQILAKAHGGTVEKAKQGWGIGLHSYDVHEPLLVGGLSRLDLPVSHQDQVIIPPKDAIVVASSSFTPYAALYYPKARALSFQGHPEFEPKFLEDLIKVRRGTRFSEDFADQAITSLGQKNHNREVGLAIAGFLKG